MCMHWTSCLCWKDRKSPSVFIGVLALVTSLLQILVAVAVFTGHEDVPALLKSTMEPQSTFAKLYIALAAADFFVVFFSIILLIGLERTDGCYRCAVISWLVWMFLYILYESAINIYYFYMELSNDKPMVFTDSLGYLIVPLVYWACKEIILFCGWSFIASNLCYGDAIKYSDSTLHLVDANSTGRLVSTAGSRDAIGPIYYNGGSSHVQIRDNPRPTSSHFDVVRPTPSCQVYSSDWNSSGVGYLGRNVYGPPRYM